MTGPAKPSTSGKRKRQVKVGRGYEILWVDSSSRYGWVHRSDLKKEMAASLVVHTIGYVMAVSKDRLLVTPTVTPRNNLDAPMMIPRVVIKRIREVRSK